MWQLEQVNVVTTETMCVVTLATIGTSTVVGKTFQCCLASCCKRSSKTKDRASQTEYIATSDNFEWRLYQASTRIASQVWSKRIPARQRMFARGSSPDPERKVVRGVLQRERSLSKNFVQGGVRICVFSFWRDDAENTASIVYSLKQSSR